MISRQICSGRRRAQPRLRRGALLASALLALLLAGGCKDDDTNKTGGPDSGKQQADSGGTVQCKRPPLALCEPPPYGTACTKYWYCPHCTCGGTFRIAACHPLTLDCRWFCTGCYPSEYVACDRNAGQNLLRRCDYCFNTDGGVPKDCHRLRLDGGKSSPSDAGVPRKDTK